MTTQEVTIHPFVKVTMQSDAEVLEDVVITGYGSAKKLGSVVGSAVAVSGEKLEKRPIANIGDALQGRGHRCKERIAHTLLSRIAGWIPLS